jgi:4-hydroxybutyrate dehydrogenase
MAVTIGLRDSSGESFVKWLRELNSAIGIPVRLSQTGVKKENLERLVQVAIEDACHQNNPRTVTSEDFRRIFSEAF